MKERVGKIHRQHEQGLSDLWDFIVTIKKIQMEFEFKKKGRKEERERERDGRREERRGKGRESGKGYVK